MNTTATMITTLLTSIGSASLNFLYHTFE
jgi:hypothetical protein